MLSTWQSNREACPPAIERCSGSFLMELRPEMGETTPRPMPRPKTRTASHEDAAHAPHRPLPVKPGRLCCYGSCCTRLLLGAVLPTQDRIAGLLEGSICSPPGTSSPEVLAALLIKVLEQAPWIMMVPQSYSALVR